MAVNTFAPSGFREARSISGLSPNYATVNFFIAYNYGTQIGFGDPVVLASGLLTLPAAAATSITGIFLGCDYFDPANPSSPPFHPAWLTPTLPSTTIVTARVCIDPLATFLVQSGSSVNTTPLTAAAIGSVFGLNTLTAPNSLTGISTNSLTAAASTGAWKLVSIPGLNDGSFGASVGGPFYNAALANQWVEVKPVLADMSML